MAISKDEWVAKLEAELQSILFDGYTTSERDPGRLFKRMCVKAHFLRDKLQAAYDDLRPPAEKPANHQPAKPAQTRQ